jgi:uroporphyrin-III C-methyltransferase/precorrin-2 dehydrogenase/sirohydrochlorin ferrochelatase
MARECMEKNGVFSNEETLFRLSTYTDEGKITLGRVSLVGAGCGCYDLITLKGVAAVRNAEVLVYDDLIDDRLLDFSSESCEKLYVGKRSGRHSMGQEEICRLLLDKAREGKYVVRLKGGDPFVFGRASEEIETLRKNNIEYDYIPGITSAVAVPGMAGIPVTSRGISRSFHVITGHTKNTTASIPEDMAAIARLNGTLVFLMGIENIHKITDALIENGKDKDTPSAVIHADIDNNTDIIRAKLSRIAEVVQANPIKPPAVIVVGEVVDGFAND